MRKSFSLYQSSTGFQQLFGSSDSDNGFFGISDLKWKIRTEYIYGFIAENVVII